MKQQYSFFQWRWKVVDRNYRVKVLTFVDPLPVVVRRFGVSVVVG